MWQHFFGKSIEIYKTNKNRKKYHNILQKCGRFVGVRVRVAKSFFWQINRHLQD